MTVTAFVSTNFKPAPLSCSFKKAAYAIPVGLAAVADTTIGIGATALGVVTLGLHEPTLMFAAKHLRKSEDILAGPYNQILSTYNNRNFIPYDDSPLHAKTTSLRTAAFKAIRAKNSAAPIKSRVLHVLYTVASIAARVTEAVIAFFAVQGSIITCGGSNNVNRLAFETLKSTGLIVNDLFMLVINLLDPSIK